MSYTIGVIHPVTNQQIGVFKNRKGETTFSGPQVRKLLKILPNIDGINRFTFIPVEVK